MTTREVKVTREVTESEEITVCDHCGSEIENPTDRNVYTPDKLTSSGAKLHYHVSCELKASLDESKGVTLGDSAGFTGNREDSAYMVMSRLSYAVVVLGGFLLGVSIMLSLSRVNILSFVCAFFGFLCVSLVYRDSRHWADDAVKVVLGKKYL